MVSFIRAILLVDYKILILCCQALDRQSSGKSLRQGSSTLTTLTNKLESTEDIISHNCVAMPVQVTVVAAVAVVAVVVTVVLGLVSYKGIEEHHKTKRKTIECQGKRSLDYED